MGKKGKTYALLLVVLSIWGVIGYRILNTINPSNPIAAKEISQVTFNPKKIKKRDTFSIYANYRDPFLGTLPISMQNKKKVLNPVKKKIPEVNITYSGYISDKEKNPTVFFVTVEGQQKMMHINDVFKDVKLIRGTKKSIRTNYKGQIKNIPLQE